MLIKVKRSFNLLVIIMFKIETWQVCKTLTPSLAKSF